MSFRPRPDPATDDAVDARPPGVRRARLEARRRRMRWAGVLVAAVILGAAGTVAAFAFTDDVPAATGPGAVSVGPAQGERSGPTTTVDPASVTVRPLSHDDPLRLWIGGDSLAGALGPALGEQLGATGVVAAHVDYKVSSGLVDGPRDWPEYATDLLAERDPEVVVFMIGANDASVVNSSDANDDGVPDWEPDYRNRVGAMMDQLRGTDPERTVIWIGAPTMRDDDRDEAVIELNRVMREEAERRAPYVVYVESYPLFADEEGEYADRLPDAEGVNQRVRVGDGVHFTPAGATRLAGPVYALLDGRFHLTAQTVAGQPLGFTMDENGEIVGGSGYGDSDDADNDGGNGGRGSNSRRGGSTGGGSRSTTTVADDGPGETTPPTEPPVTTPPTEPPPPPTTPTTGAAQPPIGDPAG
jgi:hypothetical protein